MYFKMFWRCSIRCLIWDSNPSKFIWTSSNSNRIHYGSIRSMAWDSKSKFLSRTINIPQRLPYIFLYTLPLKFSLFLQMQKHAKRSNTKAMESVNNIPVEVNESSPWVIPMSHESFLFKHDYDHVIFIPYVVKPH